MLNPNRQCLYALESDFAGGYFSRDNMAGIVSGL